MFVIVTHCQSVNSFKIARSELSRGEQQHCINPQRRDQMSLEDGRKRREAPLDTPSNLGSNATKDISAALTALLADVFALYVKTKNFHWHISGPHFRDYHLLLDEQAAQIFAMTDEIAERARKIGGTTIRSIGHIARAKHIQDNDAEFVTPEDMLAELKEDNLALTQRMRQNHNICDEHGDVATASLIENWIDETERRAWFLFETTRGA
ncbi:starvation-inducible DNA-binding protein [Bradyrhizobium sp. LA7.1]